MCKVIQWRGAQRYKKLEASLGTKISFQLPTISKDLSRLLAGTIKAVPRGLHFS